MARDEPLEHEVRFRRGHPEVLHLAEDLPEPLTWQLECLEDLALRSHVIRQGSDELLDQREARLRRVLDVVWLPGRFEDQRAFPV